MKDHCILKYCAALKTAMNKTVKMEDSRCADNPACSSECKLETGPELPEPVSRRGSTTAEHAIPAISQAKAAGEQQSAQSLQKLAGAAVPTSASQAAATATTAAPAAAAAASGGNPADAGRHDHLFRPPGGAVAGGPGRAQKHPTAAAQEGADEQPRLDEACTRCSELGVGPAPDKQEDETEDQREQRLQSKAAGLFRSVVQEATGNQVSKLYLVLLHILKRRGPTPIYTMLSFGCSSRQPYGILECLQQ